jgi:site-specific DNA-methyltransferase (adenine-specific)
VSLERALFSSARADWETPSGLFARLDWEFSFTPDDCAMAANAKCGRYFTPAVDGLRQRWRGRCWMNPPYGWAIGAWVRKARAESLRGATVVSLLPARTDTAWWHDVVMRAQEIRLLRGRLTFVGAASPAPFPSALVIFDGHRRRTCPPRVVSWDWRAGLAPDRQARRPSRHVA